MVVLALGFLLRHRLPDVPLEAAIVCRRTAPGDCDSKADEATDGGNPGNADQLSYYRAMATSFEPTADGTTATTLLSDVRMTVTAFPLMLAT